MNTNRVDWRGYWAACPTPFHGDGSFAPELIRELIEFYIDQGVHGLLVNGTTGEWFSQPAAMRRAVAETALDAVAGRIPVVVGATAYTADEVIAFARHAINAGAAGFASSSPPYAKPLRDEIITFYEDIAAGIDAPMMIYNWPPGTSVDIDTELALRLSEIDTVAAFKDSTPNVQQFYATSAALNDRVAMFGPYMTTGGHEQLLAHGGAGTIGGGSLYGAPDPQFWEDHWNGNSTAAAAHAARNEAYYPQLWMPGGWRGVHGHYASELKAVMAILGQPGGTVRRPRLPITDPTALAQLRKIVAAEPLLAAQAARVARAGTR
jgi:dihydrodipicolinate synthase/N-acetylneuraminate lyase